MTLIYRRTVLFIQNAQNKIIVALFLVTFAFFILRFLFILITRQFVPIHSLLVVSILITTNILNFVRLQTDSSQAMRFPIQVGVFLIVTFLPRHCQWGRPAGTRNIPSSPCLLCFSAALKLLMLCRWVMLIECSSNKSWEIVIRCSSFRIRLVDICKMSRILWVCHRLREYSLFLNPPPHLLLGHQKQWSELPFLTLCRYLNGILWRALHGQSGIR